MEDENKEKTETLEHAKTTPESHTSDTKNETEIPAEDKELDELLDSALEDFDKPPPQSNEEPATQQDLADTKPKSVDTGSHGSTGSSDTLPSQQEALFNDLFKAVGADQDEGQGQMEEIMKDFMAKQPELMQQFEQMMQGATTGDDSMPEFSGNFDDTLQQTLGSLAQNVQDLQTDVPDNDLMRMLSGMGFDEEGGADGSDMDMMPMMQNMMKSLMSKDVLYPSLKEITEKYPAWLEENSSKADPKEYANYQKQYRLMKEIVTEFEQEKSSDSESVKGTRFNKIMDIMQEMQALGQPPKDIVGDMPAGMDLDANGLPKFPPNPDQCSVM